MQTPKRSNGIFPEAGEGDWARLVPKGGPQANKLASLDGCNTGTTDPEVGSRRRMTDGVLVMVVPSCITPSTMGVPRAASAAIAAVVFAPGTSQ